MTHLDLKWCFPSRDRCGSAYRLMLPESRATIRYLLFAHMLQIGSLLELAGILQSSVPTACRNKIHNRLTYSNICRKKTSGLRLNNSLTSGTSSKLCGIPKVSHQMIYASHNCCSFWSQVKFFYCKNRVFAPTLTDGSWSTWKIFSRTSTVFPSTVLASREGLKCQTYTRVSDATTAQSSVSTVYFAGNSICLVSTGFPISLQRITLYSLAFSPCWKHIYHLSTYRSSMGTLPIRRSSQQNFFPIPFRITWTFAELYTYP